jgi:hypothetical protein
MTWTVLIPCEEPNLNTGNPWSSWDDQDIRSALDDRCSIEEIADFLCRTPSEVRHRIREIAEADAIGPPSLLWDRLSDRDRIALETYRDACASTALIREAVDDCAVQKSWISGSNPFAPPPCANGQLARFSCSDCKT